VKKVYLITVDPALNLTSLRGEEDRAAGKLSPGDRFQPDLKKGRGVGACDQETRRHTQRIAAGLQHSGPKKWQRTMIGATPGNISIKPSNWIILIAVYILPGLNLHDPGNLPRPQQTHNAVQHGCNRYPDWALLAELLEKLGKKSAAIDAYTKAVGVCGYKPDRDKFLQKIVQLGGSIHNIPLGKDGGKEF
jgi:hypothetical protein